MKHMWRLGFLLGTKTTIFGQSLLRLFSCFYFFRYFFSGSRMWMHRLLVSVCSTSFFFVLLLYLLSRKGERNTERDRTKKKKKKKERNRKRKKERERERERICCCKVSREYDWCIWLWWYAAVKGSERFDGTVDSVRSGLTRPAWRVKSAVKCRVTPLLPPFSSPLSLSLLLSPSARIHTSTHTHKHTRARTRSPSYWFGRNNSYSLFDHLIN